MSNQKYDAVWVEGSFFEKGHWKLVPSSGGSGLGALIMFFLLIIVLCIVILVSPLIIVLIGFSIVKHKRYYASIVSILAMIYLFIDYQKKWITSFIIFGSNDSVGKFSDGIIGIKYAPHFFFVNSLALTIAVYFLISSYYMNSNRTNENILNIKPNQNIISFTISLVFGLVSFFYVNQINHEFQKNEIESQQIDSTSSNEYSKDNINDTGYEYSDENTETEPDIVNDSTNTNYLVNSTENNTIKPKYKIYEIGQYLNYYDAEEECGNRNMRLPNYDELIEISNSEERLKLNPILKSEGYWSSTVYNEGETYIKKESISESTSPIIFKKSYNPYTEETIMTDVKLLKNCFCIE